MFSSLARKSVLAKSSSSVIAATRTAVSVRSFAVGAGAADHGATTHEPPISMYGIDARYANATYSAASKKGVLDQVESELNGLAKAAEESKAFGDFLNNPLIGRDAKAATIESVLQEKKLSQIVVNLCTTLAGNARLKELPVVASTYGKLMKAKRGEIDATIISADPLTKKETQDIQAAIKGISKGASNVIIDTQIDPSIIGGIQIQIGDQFLDLSIKSRIDQISRMSV